jgi:hypothetical protein
MTRNLEQTLSASKWKCNKEVFGEDWFGKFRSFQIGAFRLELLLRNNGVPVKEINYLYDKKYTFFKVVIEDRYIDKFNEISKFIWSEICEDLPTHRNDVWLEQFRKPNVSEIFREPLDANLIITIKLNTQSKRYYFPTAGELELNDRQGSI